jgi:alpha-amylase
MIGSLPKAYFAMGLHLHQPVGNFENILERAYSNCYSPFLDILRNYPDIKCTFHFSGNLLDFFEESHPDYLDRVNDLVRRGQIEIMGGGYYEPIFPAIPRRDRLGQIEMLSSYIEKKFGARPKGIWTPERVWSPDLVKDFTASGIKYTILDDAHLSRAGIGKDDLSGYYVTGDPENRIAIFPTTKTFRYSIPFRSPRENMRYFKRASKDKQYPLFTYGDDAEKFGEWPWTHEWVYKKGWLNHFFNELVKNNKWLKTVTFSEYLASHEALGMIDIPACAYEEMTEWAGGEWMNFLSKYPESDQMHKRMIYVSDKIDGFEIRNPKSEIRNKIENAKKELYKGQTNCPYWHGVFGGIYLSHLRQSIYEHLIKAEKIMDSTECSTRQTDFYRRGKDAAVLENKDFFVCADPVSGGVIRELDYKPWNINVANTLSRRKEDYHRKILQRISNRITEPLEIQDAIKTMDQRIKKGIFYDRYLRACLVDHFIDREVKKEEFENCNYIDLGGFADAAYKVKIDDAGIVLSREAMVDGRLVSLTKDIRAISADSLKISYSIKNNGKHKLESLFGTEFNIAVPFESIKLDFSEDPVKVWEFPVMVVSQSDRSYDLNWQANCIFPIWDIGLASGQDLDFGITWRFFGCHG